MSPRFLLSAAALLALPLLTGCIVVQKKGGNKPQAEIPVLSASLAEDRPAGFQEGAPAAFWIWRKGAEGWRVRTTTAGKEHHFRGRIEVTRGGPLTDLKPNRVELSDRVNGNPSGAAFDFKTAGYQDGVDFKVDAGACIKFSLEIDDKHPTERIFIGGTQRNPPDHTFILCD